MWWLTEFSRIINIQKNIQENNIVVEPKVCTILMAYCTLFFFHCK